MKRLVPLALVLACLVPDVAPAEPLASGGLAIAKPASASLSVAAPSYSGAFLSLVVPGGGQFYLGDSVKGACYLGLGGGASLLTTAALLSQVQFLSMEQVVFPVAIGLGILAAADAVSLADALLDIAGRLDAAQGALVPTEQSSGTDGPVPYQPRSRAR